MDWGVWGSRRERLAEEAGGLGLGVSGSAESSRSSCSSRKEFVVTVLLREARLGAVCRMMEGGGIVKYELVRLPSGVAT